MKITLEGQLLDNETAAIYRYFGLGSASPDIVTNAIKGLEEGEELEINLNSPGGYCETGATIYTLLKEASAAGHKVVINVIGQACSAATVLMCGADVVRGSLSSYYMIHNASFTNASGKSRDMASYTQCLEQIDESIINVYEQKTGKTRDELRELLDAETWMEVNKAIELGFVDDIYTPADGIKLVASAGTLLPDNVFNLMKNEFLKAKVGDDSKGDDSEKEADIINNSNGRSKKMTLDEAMKEHPELQDEVNALINSHDENQENNSAVINDAVTAERKRIQDILSISGSIPDDMVQDAMFGETPCDAKELAFKALQEDSKKASNYFKNAMEDSDESKVNAIKPTPVESDDAKDRASALAGMINAKKNK